MELDYKANQFVITTYTHQCQCHSKKVVPCVIKAICRFFGCAKTDGDTYAFKRYYHLTPLINYFACHILHRCCQ